MNNAEKFQEVFGYYATEMWAKPEAEFLDWINAEYNTTIKTNERSGEWIVYPLKDEGRVELECPECGYVLIRAADRRPHFCENCGAKMKRGTENE